MTPETIVARRLEMAHGALEEAVMATHDKVGHVGFLVGAPVHLEAVTGVEAEGTELAHITRVHIALLKGK